MRIGASVLFSGGKCVQSYQWSLFRPFGELQGIIDSLEEYQCDEICIIRPVRAMDLLEQFKADLKIIRNLISHTPISFGGGIRSVEHLDLLSGLPIERLAISSAFINGNEELIRYATALFGKQAIQCVLPIRRTKNQIEVYNSSKSDYRTLQIRDIEFIDKMANEIMLLDVDNEGKKDSFDLSLLDSLPFDRRKLIISGGISPAVVKKVGSPLAAIIIDNKALHQEYSIREYKNAI